MAQEPRPTVELRPPVESVRVIYALRDPLDEQVRYVGQARDPWQRLMTHLGSAIAGYRKDNPAKEEWLNTLFFRHRLAPILEILEFVRGKPYAREKEWIARFRAEGHQLLNGDNTAWARSPEGRARLREVNLGKKEDPAVTTARAAAVRAHWARRRLAEGQERLL